MFSLLGCGLGCLSNQRSRRIADSSSALALWPNDKLAARSTQSVQAVKCLRVLAMVLSVDTALLAHAAQSATPLSHILMLTSALPFPLHWGLKRLHTEGLPFRMQPPPRRCADPFASRPQQLSHHPCPHTASDGRAGALPARIH